MNSEIDKIVGLKLGKEIERITREISSERQTKAAEFFKPGGAVLSGALRKMLRDTGCRRIEEILRAHYAILKDVNSKIRPLTPDLLRQFAQTAEKTLENAPQTLADELRNKSPYEIGAEGADLEPYLASKMDEIKGNFWRDVEIEVNELTLDNSTATQPQGLFSEEDFRFDVFVSFSTTDKVLGDKVHALLVEKGLRVFYSPKALKAGDNWSEEIRAALVGSREICLLITPKSLQREWVFTEWGAAWALKRRITPILSDCKIDDLPLRLREKQSIYLEDLDRYVEEVAARYLK
jgi:TIR domain